MRLYVCQFVVLPSSLQSNDQEVVMETWNYNGSGGSTSRNGASNPGESSRNASIHRTQLPSRRRQFGGMPLHPPTRKAPVSQISSTNSNNSFVPALSSPLRMTDSNEIPEPSVFLTPNSISRKRSHFTASTTLPSNKTIYDSQQPLYSHQRGISHIHNSPMDAPDMADTSVLSHGSIPTGSPTSKYGSWSRKTGSLQASHFSEPQTSQPIRPPQGEFSFQAQAPSLFQSNVNHMETTTLPQPNEQQGETSSMAFARLAQAQRQQQEARRLAASGANDFPGDNSNDDHNDGPPVKKRRGVASTIVDGALSAALYTGAAALTAYTLWSSWGRKEETAENVSDAQDGDGQADNREKLPPGGLEEPPPPYTIASSSKGPVESPMKNGRPVHVFVSSRRRRPVFATRRSSKNAPKRRLSALNDLSQQSPSVMPEDKTQLQSSDEDDDEDEMFKRFQSKMSNLIEEGTRALNSEADLSAMDLEDDDDYSFQHARLSPSKSDSRLVSGQPSFPAQLPRSQTTAFTFGNEALRRPQNTSNLFSSHSSTLDNAISTSSPRSPFLSLASRDPNSPYGRISRPGSAISSPTQTARKRLH